MSTLGRGSYHHGDLRAALLSQARSKLAQSSTLSLRALAKETGVTPTAVYRHFADKQALESALAAQGYGELLQCLKTEHETNIHAREDMWRLAWAYITWARDNEPLFSLMFTTQCDPTVPERVKAVKDLTAFLSSQVQHWYPHHATGTFLTALWGFVHGITTLYLQGKILTSATADVTQEISLEEQVHCLWLTFISPLSLEH